MVTDGLLRRSYRGSIANMMPLQWCQSTNRPIDVTYRHRCSRRRHFRRRWRSKKRNNIPFLEDNESHSYYDTITTITNTVVAAIGTTRAVMRAAKTIPDRVLLYDEHACDEVVVVKMVAPPPATEYTNKRFDPSSVWFHCLRWAGRWLASSNGKPAVLLRLGSNLT